MKEQHAKLIVAMTTYDHGDPMRIQHFMKVHDFTSAIGVLEGLDQETLFVLETAAILHDIGIHLSEEKYNSSNGKYQEKEGPKEARILMEHLGGYTDNQIKRVCYLIGHHHTYHDIDGLDYQILVEADFLVNIYEDNIPDDHVKIIREKVFRTAIGKKLLNEMFLHERDFKPGPSK